MTSDVTATEWADLPLDSRIVEALRDLAWAHPTPVQSACVPLALKGKDLSIMSRTGSGKTGAFAIPIIQRVITEREQRGNRHAATNPVALILVPSVELCEQTVEATETLAKYVKPRLVIENVTSGGAVSASRVQAAHVIVSTVALLARSCRTGAITADTLKHMRYLVIDEADMIMSIAENGLRTVQALLPSSLQVILSSATLTEGVASIKGQLLRNPTNIILTTEADDSPHGASAAAPADVSSAVGPVVESRVMVRDNLKKTLHQHYLVATDECHSHTLLYALYRLALIKGKTLIFVEEDEATYRLQHFLEQLGVATLAYDANLPINVRLDTLRRFQSGAVSTLVCTDGTLESAEQLQMSIDSSSTAGGSEGGESAKKRQRRGAKSGTTETPSALHRGIDFSQVSNVILFDGVDATSSISLSRYTHRVGRAGRAGMEGTSIVIFTVPQARKSIKPLRAYCESRGDTVEPFKKMQRTESAKLQYRVDTVLGNVTRASTRKLRVATVAAELSRSSYLANHMSQKDSDALKRVVQRSSKKVRIERNLLDVPTYMKLGDVEEVDAYTQRVRAGQTRAAKFRKVTKKAPSDPLKAVASKIRTARKR